MERKHSGVRSNARLSMKAGDLVRILGLDDHPMGMVLEVRDHPSGYRIQHYLVQLFSSRYDRKPHQYLKHHLEIVK